LTYAIRIRYNQQARHSDDMQDIITAVPAWILRWGITLFFTILVLLLSMSAFIKYPDIVKTQLKITSPDMPKQVVPKITGKLVKLLINNNDIVKADQPLAYIESTASHDKVLLLLAQLKQMQIRWAKQNIDRSLFNNASKYELGELQGSLSVFFPGVYYLQIYVEDGFLLKNALTFSRMQLL
jgi:hypothetical protein